MTEKTIGKQSTKLPAISSRSATFKKSQENVSDVASASGTLPQILPDGQGRNATSSTECTPEQRSKKSSLRLPVVFESPLAEMKTNNGGDELSEIADGDSEKRPKPQESEVESSESGQAQLNSLLQRDLIFMHYSQTVSRRAYSYFKRFPSPIPVSRKKEKLLKKMAANMPKAPPEKKLLPGDLRPKKEYEALWNSVKNAQTKFVRRHKLARKPEETHALSSKPNDDPGGRL